MNASSRDRIWRWIVAGMFLAVTWVPARADAVRTQTIHLEAGWNAVFLEVHPADPDPAVVFAGTPVDIAAAYYVPGSPAQFMTDPGANLFRQVGWKVWYADERPEAFLKTLHGIFGQQAYLLHAKQAHTWQAAGVVSPPEVRWQAKAYNFAGFSVHPQAAPTFAQFFGGSSAHQPLRIYRLVQGAWQRVADAATTPMRSGEAFWIYCEGASTYQGPLRVELRTRQGLIVSGSQAPLILRNATGFPVTATLEHVPIGSPPVPLAFVVLATDTPYGRVSSVMTPKPDGAWTQPLPPLEAGQALRVPLAARLESMQFRRQHSLLKIATDLGTEIWIPVIGVRSDLKDE